MFSPKFKAWFIGIFVSLLILVGGGYLTYFWWQALGTLGQQAFLAVVSIGAVNLCGSLLFLALIITIVIWSNSRW